MKKVISVLLSLLLVALCVSPAFAAEQEDTFGAYDIAGADKLSPAERARRNKIYDTFAP